MTPARSLSVEYARLRALAEEYRRDVFNLMELRNLRDALALKLVDDGETWRDVAEAAGFENPYIAELKRKAGQRSAGKEGTS